MAEKNITPDQSKQKMPISSKNKELLGKPGMSISDIENAAKSNLPATEAVIPGKANSPRRKIADSSDVIHDFSNDDDRRIFMKRLIESKQYFVNIKQQSYHRGISLTSGIPQKKTKSTKVKASAEKPENAKTEASDEQASSNVVRGLIVAGLLWVATFLLIDLGLINVGWTPPIGIFNRGNQTAEFEETAVQIDPATL